MRDRKAPQDSPQQTELASETWNTLPWRKLEQHVFRIQKRIYRASQRGNAQAVHKLQKLLMKSEAARLVAVRRVTQENQGKKTAGVDGVKSVKPKERLVMASQIHPKHWKHQHPRPVRRVWIPKPGKVERRPLGVGLPYLVDGHKAPFRKRSKGRGRRDDGKGASGFAGFGRPRRFGAIQGGGAIR
jgi:RNA-directed DNA polymerase